MRAKTFARTARPAALVAVTAAFVLSLAAAVIPSTAATVTPGPVPITGRVTDAAGKNLVDPWCVYVWPEDANAPSGWARSSKCVELDEQGKFAGSIMPGRYIIEVEATNVAYGMFIGGPSVAQATVFTVGTKGLKGLKLKVTTLATVSGRFTDLAGKPLVNPNCVYFWFEDAESETGWTAPDECAEIDPDGYVTAFVIPGKYKLEVQADNVALDSFVGGLNTLANSTSLVVPPAGLSKQLFKMPTQPLLSGKVTAVDGSLLPAPDALYFWVPDPTSDTGWSVSQDIWDLDSKGNFNAYLVPKTYRIQVVYGNPKIRPFFGGATVENAVTFAMPTAGLSNLVLRVGKGSAPANVTGVESAVRDGGALVAWDAPAANSVAFTTVTAQPGGARCITTGSSCTITGLRNGSEYALSVAATNESGTVTADAGTIVPAVPVLTVRADASMVTAGSRVSLAITNAPVNTKITIAGKPGITTTTVTSNALGKATTSLLLPTPGIASLTATAGKASAKTGVYVPSAKMATSVKKGKTGAFSIATAKPGSPVLFSVSNGLKLTGITTTKGAFAGKITFGAVGTFTVTATVGGLPVRTATITVVP